MLLLPKVRRTLANIVTINAKRTLRPYFHLSTCAARLIADETTMDLVCKIHGAIKIDEFGIYRFSEDQTYFEGH